MQAGDWSCQECGHNRDLGSVEAQLICIVRRRVKSYQLQDLRCTKCKQVGSCSHKSPVLLWPAFKDC